MKRIYVNEEWCLGCHLCEYNCAFANSGEKNMVKALKNKEIKPKIHVEEDNKITYAVNTQLLKISPTLAVFDVENRRKKLGGMV